MKYIPLKIAIKRRDDGSSHPIGHDGVEIDQFGIGMHYQDSPDTDINGYRYAVTALPVDRANAYISRAGGDVVALTLAEAEAWFAANKKEPSQIISNEVLTGIKLKKDLVIPLTPEDTEALDPTNPRPGIVNNSRMGFKAKCPKDATF